MLHAIGELGSFLRVKRTQLSPEMFSLPTTGARRVPGLRRSEVAVLAGVSVDYYTKLEQGREVAPSAQVLHALADALRLQDEERAHLFVLSGAPMASPRNALATGVAPALRALMDGWPSNPAVVISAGLDVLARNRLADALYSGFEISDNLARMTFLDPAARDFYVDHGRACETSASNLRKALGHHPHDRRLRAVIDELTRESETFVELWSRQQVGAKTREAKWFEHPQVGRLQLSYEALSVNAAPGQELLVYHAEPGTDSSVALALLGTSAVATVR